MIQEAGGVVDYDLPPLDLGKETGAIEPADRLVRHRRPDTRSATSSPSSLTRAVAQQAEAQTSASDEVIKEAGFNGIRPMTIGKLLAYLGYDMNTPISAAPRLSTRTRCGGSRRNGARRRPSPRPRPPRPKPEADARDEER